MAVLAAGNKLLQGWAVLVIVCMFLGGCAGFNRNVQASYEAARNNEFTKAEQILDSSSLAKSRKNKLLYLMEKGLLRHLRGDYNGSNVLLEEADLLVDELYTRSVSAESFSYISNDNFIVYRGEDYETVFISYYKVLNYLGLNNVEEALVECRRIDEKLNYISDRYGSKNVYHEDAFLRLLTGLVYYAERDYNNAYVAFRKSAATYEYYQEKYDTPAPPLLGRLLHQLACQTGDYKAASEYGRLYDVSEVCRRDKLPEPINLLAVIIDRGAIPVKREAAIIVPTEYGFPVKIAVPKFVDRPQYDFDTQVSINGKSFSDMEMVENLAVIARQSLDDKMGRVMVKAVARAVAKQIAARQTEKNAGPLAALTLQIAALLTENADLRQWCFLPARISLGVLPVAVGDERVQISFAGKVVKKTTKVYRGGVGFVFARVH